MINSRTVKIDNNFNLTILSQAFQPIISEFVADIYYHEPHFYFEESLNSLKYLLIVEDRKLAPYTTTYTIFDKNREIQITARIITNQADLPIFAAFPKLCLGQEVYVEFARFASNKRIRPMYLLYLIRRVLNDLDDETIILASIDAKLYKKLRRLKVPINQLSDGLYYLGSLSLPVSLKVSELKTFIC